MTVKHTGRASLEGIREFIEEKSLSEFERELLERLGKIIDELDPPEEPEKPSKYDREPVYLTSNSLAGYLGSYKKVVFTDIPVPDTVKSPADLSQSKDKSVLSWSDGTTRYVSSLSEDKKIVAHTSISGMFKNFLILEEVDFSNLDTSETTNFSELFSGCTALKKINLNDLNLSKATNLMSVFNGCSSLEEIQGDRVEAPSILSATSFLNGCSSLKKINLRRLFKTVPKSSISLISMFINCSGVSEIDLSEWDLSGAKPDVGSMFKDCSSLEKIYTSDWSSQWSNTSAITGVFTGCTKLTGYTSSKTNSTYCKPISSGGYFSDPIPETGGSVEEPQELTPEIIAALIRIAKHVDEIDPQ